MNEYENLEIQHEKIWQFKTTVVSIITVTLVDRYRQKQRNSWQPLFTRNSKMYFMKMFNYSM